MTNGEFHETIKQLMKVAEVFDGNVQEYKDVIWGLLKKMYDDRMSVLDEALADGRNRWLNKDSYDTFIRENDYIRKWLEDNLFRERPASPKSNCTLQGCSKI